MFSKYIIKQTFEKHSHKNAINITLDEQGETENTTERKYRGSTPLSWHKNRLYFEINEK